MTAPTVSTLSNGVRVATLAMPGLRTAAVTLSAAVGARHESAPENGLAHLFEHMLFKGTARRDARGIAEAIEDVGGSLNAWTSRDGTVFHGRVLAGDLPLAIGLLSEMVVEPRFAAADLALEKDVVRAEIAEAADVPEDRVFDMLQEVAFPGQPIGRPILGTEDSLERFEPDALLRWRDTHYRGESVTLVAAGAVDHGVVVALAKDALAGLGGGSCGPAEPARWEAGVAATRRRSEQTHVTLGLKGPGIHADDHYAAQLFTAALGGGMSSRLFQELREERGLAYSVSAAHSPHAEVGMTSLYLATRPAQAEAATALALRIARDLAETLSPAELERARAQLKAGLLMGLESCAGQAEWIGRTLLSFGRPILPEEVEAAIDAVTVEAARAAGAAMLAAPLALASVGPKPLRALP
jgi:predicted Zn-dependent peptidase